MARLLSRRRAPICGAFTSSEVWACRAFLQRSFSAPCEKPEYPYNKQLRPLAVQALGMGVRPGCPGPRRGLLRPEDLRPNPARLAARTGQPAHRTRPGSGRGGHLAHGRVASWQSVHRQHRADLVAGHRGACRVIVAASISGESHGSHSPRPRPSAGPRCSSADSVHRAMLAHSSSPCAEPARQLVTLPSLSFSSANRAGLSSASE